MASLKLELLGSNLSKSWLWQAGETLWISDTWRSSRCSAPPAPGPSLWAAPLTQCQWGQHIPPGALPSGFLTDPSLSLHSGVASSKYPQALNPTGWPKWASELSLPFLKPQGNRLVCGGDGRAGCDIVQPWKPPPAQWEEGVGGAWLKTASVPWRGWATLQVSSLH